MKNPNAISNNFLIVVGIFMAMLFLLLRIYSFLEPYDFFASNDSYRDYEVVRDYMLPGEQIPADIIYSDRPMLYFFITILHRTTAIDLFQLMRIIIPLISSVSLLAFYLLYKELFKKEYLALSASIITVIGARFFVEMVGTRPNMLAVIIFPTVCYLYLRLRKDRYNPWLMVLCMLSLISAHLTHAFGTLLLGIFSFSMFLMYRTKLKKYWWLTIITIVALAGFLWFGNSGLLRRTIDFAYNTFSQGSSLLVDDPLSFKSILEYLGIWLSLLGIGGLVVFMIDTYKDWQTRSVLLKFLPALFLTGYGFFIVWLGPYIHFGILPLHMLTYLWLGLVVFAIYYLRRISKPIMMLPLLTLILINIGFTRPEFDAKDHAVIIDNEIELVDYLDENNIDEATVITQASNAAIFSLYPPDLNIITNYGQPDDTRVKLVNKLFYAKSSRAASNALATLIEEQNIIDKHNVYISYSIIKPKNKYMWQSKEYREQALENASLAPFSDGDYFSPMFDNGAIKLWKWTGKE